jgi:hypothetical protein
MSSRVVFVITTGSSTRNIGCQRYSHALVQFTSLALAPAPAAK